MKMKLPLRSPRRLISGIEELENRQVLAQFGIAWDDSMHLSMSFVPDQTAVADLRSDLYAALDAQMPRSVWQAAIFRAAQTWMKVANVNIGLVADGGQAFGTRGPTQGDPRFGDLRIGGYRMAPTVLAISIPPGSTSGTFTGDVFFNTAARFTPLNLEATALHEIGHTLGLGHSTDLLSVMSSHLNNRVILASSDVAAIRALYGARTVDINELKRTNNTQADATRIKYSQISGGYDGSTPLVAYGDLTAATDIDYYYVPALTGYSGPMTIRLKTDEISLMTPKITVMTRSGQTLAQRASSSSQADTLNVRLPNTIPDQRYYIRVESVASSSYRIGRYAIAVTFDGLQRPTAVSLNKIMTGNYETLPPEKVDELFRSPNVLFENDMHLNDSVATAVNLKPGAGQTERHLSVRGTLHDATDVDVYRVRTPAAGNNWILTATLLSGNDNPVLPRITAADGNSLPIPLTTIANGNGTFTIQSANMAANRSIFLKVASPTNQIGNYTLNVSFGTVPTELSTFVSGQILSAAPVSGKFYVAQPQLFNFALSGDATSGSVTMTVRNSLGIVVETLTARAGEVGTSISRLLAPGEYTVKFSATVPQRFSLRGSRISDPIGPVIDSTILAPQYVSPTDPNTYVYPDGTVTNTAYYWLIFLLG